MITMSYSLRTKKHRPMGTVTTPTATFSPGCMGEDVPVASTTDLEIERGLEKRININE